MQNKNPYYLHEENELNEYQRPQKRYQQLNPQSSHNNINSEEFARQNSNTKNKPYQNQTNFTYPQIYQSPQSSYQPPSYPPLPYQYQQAPQYSMPYQASQQYSSNPPPGYREYVQSSTSSQQGVFDHCPYCNKVTQSFTEQKLNKMGYFICCLLLCTTVFLFWLPFCFECFHEKRVKCISCSRTKFVIRNGC